MNGKAKLFVIIQQFIKFGIVGVSNTLLALFIYYILIFCNVHYIIANTIGFVCSVINAYYWNSKYVFNDNKSERNHVRSFIKVFVSYASTFILGTVLLYLWIDIIHISDMVAPIINLCITIPLNFLMNKVWAMK
jgi:Predicted membrane protein